MPQVPTLLPWRHSRWRKHALPSSLSCLTIVLLSMKKSLLGLRRKKTAGRSACPGTWVSRSLSEGMHDDVMQRVRKQC